MRLPRRNVRRLLDHVAQRLRFFNTALLCGGLRAQILLTSVRNIMFAIAIAIASGLFSTRCFVILRRVTSSKTHLGATCTKQRACAHLLSVLSGPLRGHNGAMCETAARLRPDIEALTARNAWGADGPIPEITVVRVAFVVHSPCRRCRIVSSRSCSACGGKGARLSSSCSSCCSPPFSPAPFLWQHFKTMAGQILKEKLGFRGNLGPFSAVFGLRGLPETSGASLGVQGRFGQFSAIFGPRGVLEALWAVFYDFFASGSLQRLPGAIFCFWAGAIFPEKISREQPGTAGNGRE